MFLLETPGGGGWGHPDNGEKPRDTPGGVGWGHPDNGEKPRDTAREDMPAKLRKVEVRGSVAQYTRNQESA